MIRISFAHNKTNTFDRRVFGYACFCNKKHLPVIAACVHRETIGPEVFRHNIVVSGLNLLALKGKTFRIGGVVLEYTGQCHPCSKMEITLGPGGYNAMRGHGGITARVIEGGELGLGDGVRACL